MISSDAQSISSLESRHECLKLLGLRQWYGRYHLPKAAKTPDSLLLKQMPATASEQIAISSDVSSNAKAELALIIPGMEGQGLVQASEQLLGATSMIEDEHPVSLVVEASKRPVSQIGELPLSMMSTNGTIIFYESQNRSNQAAESTFLQSFLKFAVSPQQAVIDIKFLEWPVFSSKALKAEQSVYFDSVFNKWAHGADWLSIKYVFYFGYHFDELEQQLLEIKIEKESACVFVPIRITIAELLGAPIKKRSLWESISRLPRNE